MPQDYVAAPAPHAPPQKSYVSDKPGRYQFTASRYVGEDLIKATPDFPAVIELPAGSKIDPGLTAIGAEVQPVKLAPVHAGEAIKKRGAAAHFGRLLKSKAGDEADDA